MTNPVCPVTGGPMRRDTRPVTLVYKKESLTFDLPGWYCDQSEESIHTGADMKLSDRMLNLLKAKSEGLLLPQDIRRIRKKLAGLGLNYGYCPLRQNQWPKVDAWKMF